MSPRTIALCGLAGSGKTTVAEHLMAQHGFVRISFADGLKFMLLGLGLTEAQLWGTEKDLPSAILEGRTPRYAMQTLGTEWGRNLIHPDLWVNTWLANVAKQHAKGYSVVTDDMRFPNESRAASSIGAHCWAIRRPSTESVLRTHESEAHAFTLPVETVIDNAGTVSDLIEAVEDTLSRIA